MNVRVLIVDDDTIARAILRVILQRFDYNVVEASSVSEADARLGEEEFDAVVCDYVMADGTGLDVLEAHPDVADRFILLTGVTEQDQLDDARVERVASYLTKPVGSDALRSALQAIGVGNSSSAPGPISVQ